MTIRDVDRTRLPFAETVWTLAGVAIHRVRAATWRIRSIGEKTFHVLVKRRRKPSENGVSEETRLSTQRTICFCLLCLFGDLFSERITRFPPSFIRA